MNILNTLQYFQMPGKNLTNCLFSGKDSLIRKTLFLHQLDSEKQNGSIHIIIDAESETMSYLQDALSSGWNLSAAIPGKNMFFPLFHGNDIDILYRLRELLQIAGYTEEKIQKTFAYLQFLKHVEFLSGNSSPQIDQELIFNYSTTLLFQNRLQSLLANNTICDEEQMNLLAKYTELSSAGPDLENILMTISVPFSYGSQKEVCLHQMNPQDILYIHLAAIRDSTLKKILLSMLLWDIEDNWKQKPISLSIFEKDSDETFSLFLKKLPQKIHCFYFAEDFFAGQSAMWKNLRSRFSVSVYARHACMESCHEIEELFGTVQTVKKSYSVDRDRRWQNNRLIDRLFDWNKTEHYTNSVPITEPRYRKEDIFSFPQGMGIAEWNGESMLFHM